jgi:hypothetical protein
MEPNTDSMGRFALGNTISIGLASANFKSFVYPMSKAYADTDSDLLASGANGI